MLRSILCALTLMFAAPAGAQAVLDCGGWQASARNIPEPWDRHSRTFANGNVRVTMLDTVEPAAGAFYLMIIAPPFDELGSRNCAVIGSEAGGMGLGGMIFDQLDATYDPGIGLTVRVPVSLFAPSTGGFDPAILAVVINQATGVIAPRYEIP